MGTLGMVLIGIGAVIGVIYGVILLVKAFQTSVWWGLGYIFVPFVSLIFVIAHWQVAKKPFLMSLISIPFIVLGVVLMPESAVTQIPQ
jgi:hypothetical protein